MSLTSFNLFRRRGVVFFDKTGRAIDGLRMVGYQSAEQFVAVLDRALAF